MAYEIGDDIVTTLKFRARGTKVLTDPTAWTVRVLPPQDAPGPLAEETVTFGGPAGAFVTLTKISTGVFEALLTTAGGNGAHAGRWKLWAVATGVSKSSRSWHILVDPPALTV